MRPIGAWIMGIYADSKGRKAGLTLSVSLMCAGSLAIAAMPTYAQIGAVRAGACWCSRGCCRGSASAANMAPARPICREMAGRERRGFYSSFQYVSLIAGQLIALAVLLVLQFTMSRGRSRGLGLAHPVRHRRGARRRRLLHPPPARRDRKLRQRQGGGRAAIERPQPVPRSSEGGVAGHGADRGRHLGLLRLHHLHAEIPGQHVGLRPRDGEPGDDRGPVRLHVPAAACPARCRTGSGASR